MSHVRDQNSDPQKALAPKSTQLPAHASGKVKCAARAKSASNSRRLPQGWVESRGWSKSCQILGMLDEWPLSVLKLQVRKVQLGRQAHPHPHHYRLIIIKSSASAAASSPLRVHFFFVSAFLIVGTFP